EPARRRSGVALIDLQGATALAAWWLATLGILSALSTVVCCAVVAMRSLIPRRAAGLRYALLSLVLLRLVVPPQVSSPISLWSLGDGVAPLSAIHRLQGAVPRGDVPAVAGADGTSSSVATPAPSRPRPTAETRALPNLSAAAVWLLTALWLAGAFWVGERLASRRRRCREILRRATVLSDGPEFEAVERVRGRFGVARQVRLVTSPARIGPFTLGILQPTIFLPRDLLGRLSRREIEAVLAHEMAHIHRFDDLQLRLQNVLSAVYFFHPALWWTLRAMGFERELDCDRLALTRGGIHARSLGRACLRLAGLSLENPTSAPAFGAKRRLEMRLESLLDPRTALASHRFRSALLAIAAALAVVPLAASDDDRTEVIVQSAAGAERRIAAPTPGLRLSLQDLMPGARVTSKHGSPIEGVELSTGRRSPVLVPGGGVVKVATDFYALAPHLGRVVVIDHGGGVETLYGNLQTIAVTAQRGVSAGALLGTAGSGEELDGPGLHFELWRDGAPIDPALLSEVFLNC
ncbi:MAG: M23/M56 family metallopeptidase, partial [Acidobacteriota bacterium]